MNKEKQKMPEKKLERLVNYQENEIKQLKMDKIYLIEIIAGLINYVKDTYNEDLTDETAEVMKMVLGKVGVSNE